MKKITLLAVAFVAISVASFKKNYTCECTTVNAALPGGSVVTNTTFKKTKIKAKTSCDELNSSSAGKTCKLK